MVRDVRAMINQRRTGRLAVFGGIVLSLGLAGIATAWVNTLDRGPLMAELGIHYSRYLSTRIEIPAGVPLTIALRNDDPIDHEWIVGDSAVHDRHRAGTEPVHETRATEVSVPAERTRTTTVTFAQPGTYLYICHLPGHEAYGMVGTLVVTED